MARKLGFGLAGGLVLLVLFAIGVYVWATSTRDALLENTFETHAHAVDVPMPLSETELEALREEKRLALEEVGDPVAVEEGEPIDLLADVDLDALALERAIERGDHLVNSRYFCVECHGKDFSGGVMLDAPPMGTWLGRNLTSGKGGVVAEYTSVDWDRIVRHGVRKNGTTAVMPSDDFAGMSDRELSDIIAYIESMPAVDNDVPEPTFGPISTMLIATEELTLPASRYAAMTDHPRVPPESEATLEFGAHLAKTCTGCHRHGLEGGPIPGGDPSWAPASNLTRGEGGVGDSYTFEDFEKVMREGIKRDGSSVALPMSLLPQYTSKMTEVEMKALWMFIDALEPSATGD